MQWSKALDSGVGPVQWLRQDDDGSQRASWSHAASCCDIYHDSRSLSWYVRLVPVCDQIHTLRRAVNIGFSHVTPVALFPIIA